MEEAQQEHQGLLRAAFRGGDTRAAALTINLQRQWPVSIRDFGGWEEGDVAHQRRSVSLWHLSKHSRAWSNRALPAWEAANKPMGVPQANVPRLQAMPVALKDSSCAGTNELLSQESMGFCAQLQKGAFREKRVWPKKATKMWPCRKTKHSPYH